jgi:predicted dinucleotide-binding enzyme
MTGDVPDIGIVGVGNMGLALALRLLVLFGAGGAAASLLKLLSRSRTPRAS